MTRRSTRITAVTGVAMLALSGAVITANPAGAASEGGWAVDTEDCPDPDAVNAPIEGEIIIGSVMPLSGDAAAVFELVRAASRPTSTTPTSRECCRGSR